MITQHVHQALAQIQELKTRIIEQQRFSGYSGRARVLGGIMAALTLLVLSSPYYPKNHQAYLIGWGTLFVLAILVNYGALAKWFLVDLGADRDFRRIHPAFDLVPLIFVGGVLTLSFIRSGQYDFLVGTWMSLFGLMNLVSRRMLPQKIAWVGLFYIFMGTVLLLTDSQFMNPWPMGLTFCIGECAGGAILEKENGR